MKKAILILAATAALTEAATIDVDNRLPWPEVRCVANIGALNGQPASLLAHCLGPRPAYQPVFDGSHGKPQHPWYDPQGPRGRRDDDCDPSAVPEPSGFVLGTFGALALVACAWRRGRWPRCLRFPGRSRWL